MFTIKVTNKKDGKTQESDFKTEEECQKWIEECESKLAWGELDSYDREIISNKEAIDDISPRQIRLALLSLGLTESSIDASIDTLPSPTKEQAMIAWKYSLAFTRSVPIVEGIGALLGLNSVQLDEVWKLARTL